ncbi:MAG: polysaccharide biosynthesis/export family protein [Pseudomonadota bacterium]
MARLAALFLTLLVGACAAHTADCTPAPVDCPVYKAKEDAAGAPCAPPCGPAAPQTPVAPAIPTGFLPWAEGFEGALRLVIGDELRITLPFYEDEDVTATVAPDGNIYLELLGAVRANGRTIGGLEKDLEARFARFLRFPEVGVVPNNFASRQVFVGGEVENAGVYPLSGPTGVLEAVFQAGGFLETADQKRVVLIRRGPNNLPMLRYMDLKSFANDGTPTENTLLAAFDIVVVPQSGIAKVNQFVRQYIEGVVPFNQSFNYTLLTAD